jgi:hypothetical protein
MCPSSIACLLQLCCQCETALHPSHPASAAPSDAHGATCGREEPELVGPGPGRCVCPRAHAQCRGAFAISQPHLAPALLPALCAAAGMCPCSTPSSNAIGSLPGCHMQVHLAACLTEWLHMLLALPRLLACSSQRCAGWGLRNDNVADMCEVEILATAGRATAATCTGPRAIASYGAGTVPAWDGS